MQLGTWRMGKYWRDSSIAYESKAAVICGCLELDLELFAVILLAFHRLHHLRKVWLRLLCE